MADIPTLKEILALRPSGGGSAEIRAAIGKAEALRDKALNASEAAKKDARAQLLTGSLDTIKAAERLAEESDLASDRCSAIIDELRSPLETALQAESAAEDAARRDVYREANEAFLTAYQAKFEQIAEEAAELTRLGAAVGVNVQRPWHESMPPVGYGINAPMSAIFKLATFAPSTIAAAQKASDLAEEASRKKRAAQLADQERRSALFLEQERLVHAEVDARNNERNRATQFQARGRVQISNEGTYDPI